MPDGRTRTANGLRLVSWNIRAGGGKRIEGIAAQLARWAPDVVGLCEYRATPPSASLAAELSQQGLAYQVTVADARRASMNALFLASRWPLTPFRVKNAPEEPGRWLTVEVGAPQPFAVGLMHVPNMVTGRKLPFLAAVQQVASHWRHGSAILLGDTNCGWPGIDEQRPVFNARTRRWLDTMTAMGWRDAFRYLKPDERCYTWYSPNAGNGFRLDQAFLNRGMLPRLLDVHYEWGHSDGSPLRRDALSDHAAMIVDLD